MSTWDMRHRRFEGWYQWLTTTINEIYWAKSTFTKTCEVRPVSPPVPKPLTIHPAHKPPHVSRPRLTACGEWMALTIQMAAARGGRAQDAAYWLLKPRRQNPLQEQLLPLSLHPPAERCSEERGINCCWAGSWWSCTQMALRNSLADRW